MKKRNIKWKKSGNIGNMKEEYNTSCIERAIEMNMINRLYKRGCHM